MTVHHDQVIAYLKHSSSLILMAGLMSLLTLTVALVVSF